MNSTDKPIRTRFAPSPTGYMHIGNLRTALYSYLYAKKNNGSLVLRIEDTDQSRYVEGAVEIIIKTLNETGLIYDEGPDKDGGFGPYVQSQRKTGYLKYALELIDKGAAYYCFCSKERLESLTDENGTRKYDKHCLHLSKEEIAERLASGEPYVIRQNVPETKGANTYTDMVFGEITVDNSEMEDQILIKSDGMPTYNFANVIDDHLMNINCVLRGSEYLTSTPKYNMLYDAFGWDRPVYIHLPSIMKDARHKLSKRDGSASYADLIEKGYLTDAIINYIALLGWAPKDNREKMSFAELMEAFDISGISHSNSIFDENKLKWLNAEYIKELPLERLTDMLTPYLDKSCAYGKLDYTKIARLAQTRISTLAEVVDLIAFTEKFDRYDLSLYEHKKLKCDISIAKTVLPRVYTALEQLDVFDEASIHDALLALVADMGLKNGQVLWPARVALSGLMSTPGGAVELADLFGKTESLRRIALSIDYLNE